VGDCRKVLVVGYAAKKVLARIRGDPSREQVTTNPVSPPDRDVVLWGLAGVDEGTVDHDRCSAGSSASVWRKVDKVFGTGEGFGPY